MQELSCVVRFGSCQPGIISEGSSQSSAIWPYWALLFFLPFPHVSLPHISLPYLNKSRLEPANPPDHSLPMRLIRSLIFLLLLLCASCATRPVAELKRYEFEQAQMGLPFRIVLYSPTASQASNAADAAFARIRELNDLLSDYEPESELSRLSATSGSGKSVPLGPDLWIVLKTAQELSEKSRGTFDVSVGPYTTLWRRARREQKLPDPNRLLTASQSVGYRHIKLDSRSRTAQLLVPGMRLDLGGIAKGYAVDEAQKILKKHGIANALVSGGGDMYAAGSPPGKPGWRVALAPLDAPDAPPTQYVCLKNRALATSGDLFQHLEFDGKRYSHIVDPRTGIGLIDHSLVVITAPNCMTADSLTKVVSVDASTGIRIVSQAQSVETKIVKKPNDKIEIFETKGFKKYYCKD